MGAVLLYVPYKQLQENYIYRKIEKKTKHYITNNFNLAESKPENPKTAIETFKNKSDHREKNQDKARSSLTAPFEQSDDRENIIKDKANTDDHRNNPENMLKEINVSEMSHIDNGSIASSSTVQTNISAFCFEQCDEDRDTNYQQDEATCTNLDKNHEEKFSLLELQSYYSIKMEIKVFFMFTIIQLMFCASSLFCLQFCLVEESMVDSCSTWFKTAFYVRGILFGFYTGMFNPLCFVGHSPSFVVLEKRFINPIGGIARAIWRFTCWHGDANIISLDKNHYGVPNMV